MKAGHLTQHRRLLGALLVVVSLAIAGIYLVVIPPEASAATGVVKYVVLYAHSMCWLLLAATAGVWTWGKRSQLVSVFAYMALGSYVAFWASLFYVRSML